MSLPSAQSTSMIVTGSLPSLVERGQAVAEMLRILCDSLKFQVDRLKLAARQGGDRRPCRLGRVELKGVDVKFPTHARPLWSVILHLGSEVSVEEGP